MKFINLQDTTINNLENDLYQNKISFEKNFLKDKMFSIVERYLIDGSNHNILKMLCLNYNDGFYANYIVANDYEFLSKLIVLKNR